MARDKIYKTIERLKLPGYNPPEGGGIHLATISLDAPPIPAVVWAWQDVPNANPPGFYWADAGALPIGSYNYFSYINDAGGEKHVVQEGILTISDQQAGGENTATPTIDDKVAEMFLTDDNIATEEIQGAGGLRQRQATLSARLKALNEARWRKARAGQSPFGTIVRLQ